MIAEHNRKSFYWGIPGIVLQIGPVFLLYKYISDMGPLTTEDLGFVNFLRGVGLVGTILLLIGIVYYTKAKGRHWAWCLLAFVPFGVLVLVFLKDKELPCYVTSTNEAQSPNVVRTSRLAIASLVLGILGLFTLFLTSLPSIILGVLALIKIQRNHSILKGNGLAIAGITISSLFLIISILALVFG